MSGVLVVDDMPQTRRFLCWILDREGFKTFEAENGAAAYAAARSHQSDIDVALVDVEMPGAGGKEVGAALQRTLPDAHVIFITGYDTERLVADRRLDSGAEVLQKPFTIAAVIEAVRARTRLSAPARSPE